MVVIHPQAPALPSGTHTLINTLALSPSMHISCFSVRQMRDTLRVIIILIQFSVLSLPLSMPLIQRVKLPSQQLARTSRLEIVHMYFIDSQNNTSGPSMFTIYVSLV